MLINNDQLKKFNLPARLRWEWLTTTSKSASSQALTEKMLKEIPSLPHWCLGTTGQPAAKEYTEKPAKQRAGKSSMKKPRLLLAIAVLSLVQFLSFVIWVSALVLYVMTGEGFLISVGGSY